MISHKQTFFQLKSILSQRLVRHLLGYNAKNFSAATLSMQSLPLNYQVQFKKLQSLFSYQTIPAYSLYRGIHTSLTKMSEGKASQFVLPNNQPFVDLDCQCAFNSLNEQEKLYAHYLSRASWYGGLIVHFQTSPESPLIFSLLHRLFLEENVDELKKRVIEEAKITEEELQAFLVYASGVFANSGNYKGMGDKKILPNISCDSFLKVIKSSSAYKRNPTVIQALWDTCSSKIYSLEPTEEVLGFSEKGTTTYFTPNCTEKDSERVSEFLKEKNLEAYNNRVFKIVNNNKVTYEIRMASVLDTDGNEPFLIQETEFQDCKYRVTRGDYSPLLKLVNENLEKAKEYASNDLERNMLDQYIESFKTGSLDAHKQGSLFWIKNKGPIIETYIGFIETYRDPAGMRAEFEGMVAMVNKEMTIKFSKLVNGAEKLLKELPWPAPFEKDAFLTPDFTSLDILTLSGSCIPQGINIPNYDKIREEIGFKNVSLGNVITSSRAEMKFHFVSDEDSALMKEHAVTSFEMCVGLHELLGHGSGKLFRKEANGEFNFDTKTVVNPLTSEEIKLWYEVGENYDSKFTSMGSSYEECRAECVALYLSLQEDVLKIFGLEGEQAQHVVYVLWLSMLWNGAGKALDMYQPSTKTWMQAHAQARYVILRVCLEAAGGLLSVKEAEGGQSLILTLDRTKIHTIGRKAIGDFLLKLQVYKSTGDVKSAEEMYNRYSEVPEDGPHPWAKWHSIVVAHKQPTKIFVLGNTKINGKGTVELVKYPANAEGYLQSWVERFPTNDVDTIMENLWKKDAKHFYPDKKDAIAVAL